MSVHESGEHEPRRGVRPAKPLKAVDAAHLMVRVLEAVNYRVEDTAAAIAKAQQVEFGLSAEVEFAAIASWLGRCRIVQRLDQLGFRSLDLPPVGKIPDLFAVIHNHGESMGVLIEVKTSEDLKLQLKDSYLHQLQEYSCLCGHPLMIAWKPRLMGMWIVFDPRDISRCSQGFVDWQDALKNDLLPALFGDYVVIPQEHVGLTFVFERAGEEEPTESGFVVNALLKQIAWHDCHGESHASLSNGLAWTIIATSRVEQRLLGTQIHESFLSTGAMIRAQGVLRAVVNFRTREGEQIHWAEIGQDLSTLLRVEELSSELEKSFGTFVRYVLHTVPHRWPAWVPNGWKNPATVPTPGSGGVKEVN